MEAMVVAFEYPGYSTPVGTKGKSTISSVKWVTLTALNWVRQMWGIAPQDIIMIGRSIGTGAAAEAAALYEQVGLPLGGLILLAPYSSIRSLVTSVVATHFYAHVGVPQMVSAYATESYSFDTLDNVKKMLKTPLLLVHGGKDELIPSHHTDDILAVAPSKKHGLQTSIIYPEMGHNDIGLDDVARDRRFRQWWGTAAPRNDDAGIPVAQMQHSACEQVLGMCLPSMRPHSFE